MKFLLRGKKKGGTPLEESRREELIVRVAKKGDEKQIAEVYKQTYPNGVYPYSALYDPTEIKKWIKDKKIILVVAEQNGLIVGSSALILYGEYGEVARLAVMPSKRKQGIGRLLLEERLKIAKNLNLKGITSEGRALEPNTHSNLWKRGFKPYGIIPQKYILVEQRESMVSYFKGKETTLPYVPKEAKIIEEIAKINNGKIKEYRQGKEDLIITMPYVGKDKKENEYYQVHVIVGSSYNPKRLIKEINKNLEKIRDKKITIIEVIIKPANKESLAMQKELIENGYLACSLIPNENAIAYIKLIDNGIKLGPLSLPETIPKELREAIIEIDKQAREKLS